MTTVFGPMRTPCHGEPFDINMDDSAGYLGHDSVESFSCPAWSCNAEWDVDGNVVAWPRWCEACHAPSVGTLCEACQDDLPRACARCGRDVADAWRLGDEFVSSHYCAECLHGAAFVAEATAAAAQTDTP